MTEVEELTTEKAVEPEQVGPRGGRRKRQKALVPAEVTPNQLVAMAIQQNIDPDGLGKLLAVRQAYEADEARKAYVRDMARFKAEVPSVLGRTEPVDTGRMKYKFTPLPDVLAVVAEPLARHGFTYSWVTGVGETGGVRVTCRVTHVQGHYEEVSLEGPPDDSGGKSRIQQIGSTTSYLERYTLQAILGLATADQDDADRPGRGRPAVKNAAKPQPEPNPAKPDYRTELMSLWDDHGVEADERKKRIREVASMFDLPRGKGDLAKWTNKDWALVLDAERRRLDALSDGLADTPLTEQEVRKATEEALEQDV